MSAWCQMLQVITETPIICPLYRSGPIFGSTLEIMSHNERGSHTGHTLLGLIYMAECINIICGPENEVQQLLHALPLKYSLC